MDAMEPGGSSKSWEKGKNNHLRLFEKMRTEVDGMQEKFPTKFDLLPESSVCDPQLYALLATYLTDVYKIETGAYAGGHLSIDTVVNTLRSLINMAKGKWQANGSSETKLFFTCLDKNSGTTHAQWLQGLEKKIHRKIFQRSKEAGEDMDNSAVPVYPSHMSKMCAAYAREGSPQGAMRKFAIKTAYLTAGEFLVRVCICSVVC